MAIIRCPTPEDAESAVTAMQSGKRDGLFVFFGSIDPGTGESWCKDCATADPVLRKACRQFRPDLGLHECPVGDRAEWKGITDHPYRLHPLFRLVRIPTLILIEGGCERGRLVEADCAKPELLQAFLTKQASGAAKNCDGAHPAMGGSDPSREASRPSGRSH